MINNIRENTDDMKRKTEIRRQRFFALGAAAANAFFRLSLDFDCEVLPSEKIEGPIVVCFNHSCAYDPIFIGVAFRRKTLSFIASEHILRSRPWGRLLERYISIIPHSKGARTNRTALTAIKRVRKGESVFLAHEGEQTWDGVSMPVMPYTGKLVKSGGATLVTYRIEGAYLTKPRWSFTDRKGKITGHIAGIYGPEELKAMSEAEIEEIIVRDTYFDVWEWQRTRSGGPVHYRPKRGGTADGLERAVFTCPACGRMGTLRSSGDEIRCSCGSVLRMNDTGFFEQPAPFETVADWSDLDRKSLRKRLIDVKAADSDTVLFEDGEVRLSSINEDHTDNEIACGGIEMRCSGGGLLFSVCGREFPIEKISDMKMVLANRILFSDKEGYYEIKTDKRSRTNLRKYLMAYEIISAGDVI